MSSILTKTRINNFKEAELITDKHNIKTQLPGYGDKIIDGLIFTREGDFLDSNMTAWGLHQVVGDSKIFKISKEAGLIPLEKAPDEIEIRKLKLRLETETTPPKHAAITAEWNKSIEDDGIGNNILGGNGRFITEEDLLEIPIIEASEEALSYYGATLLEDSDVVVFSIEPYPIWGMTIGKNYVDHYLMTEKGGGFYVEYHNDKPHFHMPLSEDAGGFYLLGKKVEDECPVSQNAVYHFTGFKIPYGKAVYTSGGTIHCDAALHGSKWIVGYTVAEDFSTVNLRHKTSGKMTCINPLNPLF